MAIHKIESPLVATLSGRDRMHISKNVKSFLVPKEDDTEEERMHSAMIMGYIHRLLSKANTVGDVVYYMPPRLLKYTGLDHDPEDAITTVTFETDEKFIDLIEERIVINLLFSD